MKKDYNSIMALEIAFDWNLEQKLHFPMICPFCEGNQPIQDPRESPEVFYFGRKESPRVFFCSSHYDKFGDFIRLEWRFIIALIMMYIIPMLLTVAWFIVETIFGYILLILTGILSEIGFLKKFIMFRKQRTDIFFMLYTPCHAYKWSIHESLFIRAQNKMWLEEFLRLNKNVSIYEANFDFSNYL